MASTGMVVIVIVVLIALACVVSTVRNRRWRRAREQSYPDHVRRRIQASEQGKFPVDGSRPGMDPSRPASRAVASGSLDARTGQLLSELCAIGLRRGFLTMQGKDSRTREIGAELDRMGGMRKMLEVHSLVQAEIGRLHARHLEAAWDGIGSWQG